MTKTPYSFSVLRYVHDPVSQEFANIGVAVFSTQARYMGAICATNYGRISKIFGGIDGNRFRQATRYIQDQIQRIGRELSNSLFFEPTLTIETLLASILPPDDSAFQFSPAGVGVSTDLNETLKELFSRFVDKYSSPEQARRDKEEIWKVYREPLDRRHLTPYLTPKKIVAPNYEYEFQHSWKNEVHHLYEPVSFDLIEANSILEKANRWVGRATSLADSSEKFQLHLLLGEPQDISLRNTFTKARNILHKMPGNPELIRENEAEDFAEDLAREIRAHVANDDPRL
jgi:Protein of unknown function (DUF3037)